MHTCTHCDSPQPETHQYRTPEGAQAICNACVSSLAQMLPRHVCADALDLTPYEFH